MKRIAISMAVALVASGAAIAADKTEHRLSPHLGVINEAKLKEQFIGDPPGTCFGTPIWTFPMTPALPSKYVDNAQSLIYYSTDPLIAKDLTPHTIVCGDDLFVSKAAFDNLERRVKEIEESMKELKLALHLQAQYIYKKEK